MNLCGHLCLLAAALGMTPAGDTHLGRQHVVYDGIVVSRADAVRHMVHTEGLTYAPSDIVISAGRIAAHAKCAHEIAVLIERQPAAKHHHSTDVLAYIRILRSAIRLSFTREQQ